MNLYMTELLVADLAESLAWYRDCLGLVVEMTDPAGGFVLLSAGSSRLALKQGTPVPGGVTLVFEVSDLASLGVEPEGPIKSSEEGYRRALFRDPDGYTVSLFEWGKKADATS